MRGNCLYKKQFFICQQITLVIVHVKKKRKKEAKINCEQQLTKLKKM
jgi:hypothetical protein